MRLVRIFNLALLSGLLIACNNHTTQHAQGYIEGRYTYITASVSGVLKELAVARGTIVKAGQPLFHLEGQPETDQYQAAEYELEQAKQARAAIVANLAYAKITFERYQTLVPQNAIQRSQLDQARATYDATQAELAKADAEVAASLANLAQANWTKNQKVQLAPVDATVFDTYYRLGERTQAGQPILSLLAPADIKAIFYVSSKDLKRLRLNQAIDIRCWKCADWREARVSYISPSAEYTPPVIYSLETNSKLVYRIEAEFAKDIARAFHPGEPIEVQYQK